MTAFRNWQVWAMLSAIAGAIILVGNVASALGTLNPWLPATRGYVNDAMSPILVASLRNTIEIIDSREAAIRVRMDMYGTRLLMTPNDPVIQGAWAAAKADLDKAEFDKGEAQCQLRVALGLGCGVH